MINAQQNLFELQFLNALSLTVATEAVVILALFWTVISRKSRCIISWENRIAAATIPSIATLPYLWFILPAFIRTFMIRTVVGEIGIVLSELIMIRFLTGVTWRWASFLSLVANMASITVGIIVF